MHDERVVHRDLKPANFLLVEGKLKLIDFGIAKAMIGDTTSIYAANNQMGTVNYMSPEAANPSEALDDGLYDLTPEERIEKRGRVNQRTFVTSDSKLKIEVDE